MIPEPERTSLHNYVLPIQYFRELARGRGAQESIRFMRSAERSRRLVMIRILLTEIAREPAALGPLPSFESGWHALVSAGRHDPTAVETVIQSPQVGIWLSRILRLLRGGAVSPGPLWVEAGHIHAVAFAAAIRSKTELRTRVPVRSGQVMLPTLGMVRLAGDVPWTVADAETSAAKGARLRLGRSEVAVPSDPAMDGDGWWGMREVVVNAGGLDLSVWLDDLDPYRDLADPVAMDRLDDMDFQRWQRLIGEAWEIINRIHPETAQAMSVGFDSLAPSPMSDRTEIRSSSTGDGFGAALISRPPDSVSLAIAMIHEFQHIKLGGLLHLVPLLDPQAHSVLVYAPWRDDPRPVAGLLQGIYAFFGIARFWQHYRHELTGPERVAAEFEFAFARRQTQLGLSVLRRAPLLTRPGRHFMSELEREVRAQQAERVPVDSRRGAWAAAVDHQAVWRLRHLKPDDDGVGRLVQRFLAGRPARGAQQVESVLTPDVGDYWHHARVALYRKSIYDPQGWGDATSGSYQAHEHQGASQADLALVKGRTADAQAGYRALIAADPGNIQAWAGLVLAASADGTNPAWRSFVRRPELVRAIYLGARTRRGSVSPITIAEWLEDGRGRERWPR